jgi:hypothetical protein
MQMIRHNDDGINMKRFALFYIPKGISSFINLINQQVIVFPSGKIDGEKPQGSWYVKTPVFYHAVFDTRAMRLITPAHPLTERNHILNDS